MSSARQYEKPPAEGAPALKTRAVLFQNRLKLKRCFEQSAHSSLRA
jgi:hypothetical protein